MSGRYDEILNSPPPPDTVAGVPLVGGSIQANLLLGVTLTFASRNGVAQLPNLNVALLPKSNVVLHASLSKVNVSLALDGLSGDIASNCLKRETRDSQKFGEASLLMATDLAGVVLEGKSIGVEFEFLVDFLLRIEARVDTVGVLKFVDITTVSAIRKKESVMTMYVNRCHYYHNE